MRLLRHRLDGCILNKGFQCHGANAARLNNFGSNGNGPNHIAEMLVRCKSWCMCSCVAPTFAPTHAPCFHLPLFVLRRLFVCNVECILVLIFMVRQNVESSCAFLKVVCCICMMELLLNLHLHCTCIYIWTIFLFAFYHGANTGAFAHVLHRYLHRHLMCVWLLSLSTVVSDCLFN